MPDNTLSDLTRPIIGIENRTPQEVFDIMADRIRADERARNDGGEAVAWRWRKADDPKCPWTYGNKEPYAKLDGWEIEPVYTRPAPPIAPVQGYTPGIPWEMHLRAYDAYCKKWSPQPALIDLEGRNCRGGFGTEELDMFIPGWREELSERTALKREIADLRAALNQKEG